MQFVYRLGVVVIGTGTFLGSAFVITVVGSAVFEPGSGTRPTEAVVAVVGCAALGAGFITWGIVRVWRWICGQDARSPVQRRLTPKENARFNEIVNKTSRKPLSPRNVVSEMDLAWLQKRVGDLDEGRELIHLIRQSNTLNTLKPEDVAEFVQKHAGRG
jgi:hypothetical protein